MELVLSQFTEPSGGNNRNSGMDVSGKGLKDFLFAFGVDKGKSLPAATVNALSAGASQPNLLYKGVLGRLVCQVVHTECTAKTNGNLSGKAPDDPTRKPGTQGTWFFVPVDPSVAVDADSFPVADAYEDGMYFIRGGKYELYEDYADYGYWITTNTQGNSDPSDDTVTITATSRSPADWDTTKWTAFTRPGNPKPTTAKYNGKALGIAAVDSFSTSGARSTQSGEFTADVELTAKFDATPSLEGTIDNFGGVAAGRGWSVDLDEAELSGAGRTSNTANSAQTFGEINGERTSSSEVGSWTGQAYGDLPVEQGTHPLGFHGTFWADFKDGRAAGGYAAERIER